VEDVKVPAWSQFPWLAWTEPDEIASAVAGLFDQYQVKIFGPSHGNVIRRDFGRFVPLLEEGMRRAAAMPFSHTWSFK
jgi:hypothetical protein